MAVEGEALDIVLSLQGVPTYVAGMREAAAANKEFNASAANIKKTADENTAAMKKQEAGAALVGKAMKASALLMGAALVEGFKLAANFESAMERIHTQAGATQQEVNNFGQSILELAGHGAKQA